MPAKTPVIRYLRSGDLVGHQIQAFDGIVSGIPLNDAARREVMDSLRDRLSRHAVRVMADMIAAVEAERIVFDSGRIDAVLRLSRIVNARVLGHRAVVFGR